jgi:hypothetical protein
MRNKDFPAKRLSVTKWIHVSYVVLGMSLETGIMP